MSQMGQSRRFDGAPITSAIARLADIFRIGWHVSKVPYKQTAVGLQELRRFAPDQETVVEMQVGELRVLEHQRILVIKGNQTTSSGRHIVGHVSPNISRRSYKEMKIAHPHQSMLCVNVYAVIACSIDVQVSVGGRRPGIGIVQKDHGGIMGAAAPIPLHHKVV
jgi:hypothetical protein